MGTEPVRKHDRAYGILTMGKAICDLTIDVGMRFNTSVWPQNEVRKVRHAEHWAKNPLHRCYGPTGLILEPQSKLIVRIDSIDRVENSGFNSLVSNFDAALSDFVWTACVHLREVKGTETVNMLKVIAPFNRR